MQANQCFWNGQSAEFHGYNPCDEVVEAWGDNIVIFEAQETPVFENQPPFVTPSQSIYPTGRWMAVSRESEMFEHVGDPEVIQAEGRMFVEPDIFHLMLDVASLSE